MFSNHLFSNAESAPPSPARSDETQRDAGTGNDDNGEDAQPPLGEEEDSGLHGEEGSAAFGGQEATLATKPQRARRPDLDVEYLRKTSPNDSNVVEEDKLWDLFLEVAVPMDSLEDFIQKSERDYQKDHWRRELLGGISSAKEEALKRRRTAEAQHLDKLMRRLRMWQQLMYPYGLGMRDFSRKVEKATLQPRFTSYRSDLIRKYKTTNWKEEALKASAPPQRDETPLQAQRDPSMVEEREDVDDFFPSPDDDESRMPVAASAISDAKRLEIQQRRQRLLEAKAKSKQHEQPQRDTQVESPFAHEKRKNTDGANDGLTDAQKERVEANRRRALERRRLQVQKSLN